MQAGWWLEWARAARRRVMGAYKNRRSQALQTARLTIVSLAFVLATCAPYGHTPYSVLAMEMDAASKGDRLDIEPSADRWTSGGGTADLRLLLLALLLGLLIGWALGMRSRPTPTGPDKAKIRKALEDAFSDRRREANVHSLDKSIEVLNAAEKEDVIGKMKVSAVLEALPGIGKVRAVQLMEKFKIADSRRVRGLGDNQRRALLQEFSPDSGGR